MPRRPRAVSYLGRSSPPLTGSPPTAAGNATGRDTPVMELERALSGLVASVASVTTQRSGTGPLSLSSSVRGTPPLPASLLGAAAMAVLGGSNSRTPGMRRMTMGDQNFGNTVQGDANRRPQDAQVTADEVRRFAGDDLEVIDLNQNRDRIQRTTWW